MSEMALPPPRPRPGTAPILILGIVAFGELVAFGLGLALGARGWDAMVLLLALVTAFFAAGPIVFDALRPPERRQVLISTMIAVYVLYLVVPVFTDYFLPSDELAGGMFRLASENPANIVHAQAVALLGLIGLLLGFYTPLGRVAAGSLPKPTREWNPQATLVVAFLTLGVGWLVYLPGQLQLIPRWAGSGALGTAASGTFYGISLLALAWLRHRDRFALLLLPVVVPLTMAFNFFTGSKHSFLMAPFMVGLAYVVYERRIRKSWLVAGFLLLVAIYPINIFYREAVIHSSGGGIRQLARDPEHILGALSQFQGYEDYDRYIASGLRATGARLNGMGVLNAIVRDTPKRVPYQGGWTLGLIFVSYVPRVLWPSKPETTIGPWVCQTYGSPFNLTTAVGPTWIGEFFFNWGHLGVALGMFAMGVLFRVVQERLFFWNAPIPALFGATAVLRACVWTLQGAVLSPVNGTVYALSFVLMAHLFVGLTGGYRLSPGAPRALPIPERSA